MRRLPAVESKRLVNCCFRQLHEIAPAPEQTIEHLALLR
jgi:hypothetical protein